MFIWFKFAWLNNLHYGNMLDSAHRIAQGSNGFSFRFSESCNLNCAGPDSPSISDDAVNNIKHCDFLSSVSENGLRRRMETILRKATSHPDRFEVSCDMFGSLKSIRFMEKPKQKDPAFVVLVFDTATCSLVRIDNFCEFIENSELIR
ncbi:MAG TPA: hypothetical protein DCR04_03400 [Flavobacteriales bacterium]|nr:hypothetical protein [Flavobacteriales bacterium]